MELGFDPPLHEEGKKNHIGYHTLRRLISAQSETLQLPDVSESEREKYGIRPDMQYHGSDGQLYTL